MSTSRGKKNTNNDDKHEYLKVKQVVPRDQNKHEKSPCHFSLQRNFNVPIAKEGNIPRFLIIHVTFMSLKVKSVRQSISYYTLFASF